MQLETRWQDWILIKLQLTFLRDLALVTTTSSPTGEVQEEDSLTLTTTEVEEEVDAEEQTLLEETNLFAKSVEK